MKRTKKEKVFVAMSGGVDSSVAALLLKEKGYDVVGITMCFGINFPKSRKPSCCGADGIHSAKKAAQILGIPHYVLDFSTDLDELVINNFVEEYLNGRTPNPCVRCNQFLKFDILYKKVMALGGDYLATGHYAKIQINKRMKTYELKRGKDRSKDQSYFLFGLKKSRLPKILFPLGNLLKTEVRKLAQNNNLNTANKPESQDICFVGDEGYKAFIKKYAGESVFKAGDFINENGKVVGQHKGIINYTIGQRDKLGIALGYPVYVNTIDKKNNLIHVGPKEKLLSGGLLATQVNFLSIDPPQKEISVKVKIRYNSPEVEAKLVCAQKNCIQIKFKNPQKSVTPGQSVVFYRRNMILGGAIIKKALP